MLESMWEFVLYLYLAIRVKAKSTRVLQTLHNLTSAYSLRVNWTRIGKVGWLVQLRNIVIRDQYNAVQ